MTDTETGLPRPSDRQTWLRSLRRANEQQEDDLDPVFDEQWGEVEDTHRAFVERFLSMLPPEGSVLDAACGTGKYFPMVLASGRSLLGVDQSSVHLATAQEKHPRVLVEKHDLQDLPYRDQFDGVMCVDAMEFVPPEDWPGILKRFRQAMHSRGWLYLTVELLLGERVREMNAEARRSGLPVVEGEVIWDEPDGYYHHYPTLQQVRAWITDAGFGIEEETEGPWHEEGYAYRHVLARLEPPSG